MTLIPVTSVWLNRAEGPIAQCYEVGVSTLEEADKVLHGWAITSPKGGHSGYDKCDFRVTFADCNTYSGRFDLQYEHGWQSNLLGDQMYDFCAFYAGKRCPSHMTESQYTDFLKNEDPKEYIEFLTQYDLGKGFTQEHLVELFGGK